MERNVASQDVDVFVFDSATGLPKTGLTDVTVYLKKDTGSFTILSTASGVATESDATHAKGWYKIAVTQSETNATHLTFAAYSAGTSTYASPGRTITTTAPNASLMSLDSSGRANVGKINDISTSSVTTVSANQGTTQPVNFTGTAGSALVKGDAIDIGGTAQTGADLGAGVAILAAYRAGVRKNTALSNFQFLMTDSTNHNPATGLTVSVTRAIDNGAFGGGSLSSVNAVGNGIYRVDFLAGDLNGDVITLRATATGADDTFVTFKTSP